MTRLTTLALATALATMALPAFANGIQPAPVVVPPVVVANDTWAGGYVGGSLGYVDGEGTFCQDNIPAFPAFACSDVTDPQAVVSEFSGGLFGITGGYDWQSGSIVYGVAGDLLVGSDAQGFGESTIFGCGGGQGCSVELESLVMIRGRVGYDAGSYLPYATAGIASASYEVGFEGIDDTFNSDTVNHFVAGAGIDYMATQNISVGVEYLHLFESDDVVFVGAGGCTPATPCGVTDFSANILRLNVAYRF